MCEDERDYENGLPNILLQFVELTGNSWIYNMQSHIIFNKRADVPVRIALAIYGPMIYTAPYVMLLMRANPSKALRTGPYQSEVHK